MLSTPIVNNISFYCEACGISDYHYYYYYYRNSLFLAVTRVHDVCVCERMFDVCAHRKSISACRHKNISETNMRHKCTRLLWYTVGVSCLVYSSDSPFDYTCPPLLCCCCLPVNWKRYKITWITIGNYYYTSTSSLAYAMCARVCVFVCVREESERLDVYLASTTNDVRIQHTELHWTIFMYTKYRNFR